MILVLKILGIVLLIILLTLILLLVLPWKINLVGDFDEKKGKASFHSFLYFVRANAIFDGELKYRVSILFGLIKIISSDSLEIKSQEKIPKQKYSESKVNDHIEDDKKNKPKKNIKKESKIKKEKVSLKERIDEIFSEEKRKALKKLLERVLKFVNSLHLNFKGTNIVYSMFEPSQTGILTGIISLFPMFMGDGISIMPDFSANDISIRGQIKFNGRIILVSAILFLFNTYKDKEIRKLF